MIPKVIHYCWFGRKTKTKLVKKCIESWKKYCPDYEIKEWNEDNFDINCSDYVKEAYEAKKWAFVSDYARFKILYENGGVYLDTDVELIKPISNIVEVGNFMGVESNEVNFDKANKKITFNVAPGLGLATMAELPLYKEVLDEYNKIHFLNADGSFNLKTIVEYTTEILIKHGLKPIDEIQCVADIYIYPKDYFNPYNMDTGEIEITDNTISIHHYAASWIDGYSKFRAKVYQLICKYFGIKMGKVAKNIFSRNR